MFQLRQFKHQKVVALMKVMDSHTYETHLKTSPIKTVSKASKLFIPGLIVIPESFLPPLSFSGCGAAHPDRPPRLQRPGAADQCHTGVSGQRGLPLILDSGLEGGGQQHVLGGVKRPGGPGEGRPLQLEQHPDPPCRPVEEGGLSEL